MSTTTSPRPFIGKVEPKAWHNPTTGETTPGLIVVGRAGIAAHLTWNEARTFADSIHDLCDANGDPEPHLPAINADNE